MLEVGEHGLEPGIGGGCKEEAGEAPDRVGERGTASKVRQGDKDPLGKHVLLVLRDSCSEYLLEYPSK